MENTVESLVGRARRRISTKTLIQDVSEPLTGEIDRRKLAAKFSNIEHAVDDLATAVEQLNDQAS
jgi:hypothetical protein